MIDMSVDFAGVNMKNPIVLASGTCGFGRELAQRFDLGRLGGISTKGLTLAARGGNDGTRIWETPSGLMNSIGLENPGVPGFIENELDWVNNLGVVNIVNLGGHCIDDYIQGLSLLNDVRLDMIELNISCPNVRQGGMNFGVKAEIAREVVREARRACRHRMIVKLSPNAEDIVALARTCEEEGADGISLVNTFLAMAIDVYKRRPVFDNTYAGLSGPAIRPIALRMVHQVARAVNIPVMGLGGIQTWRDAVEFIMAGATAVQVGTATLVQPDVSLEIVDGIHAFMEEQGIESLAEIRGVA